MHEQLNYLLGKEPGWLRPENKKDVARRLGALAARRGSRARLDIEPEASKASGLALGSIAEILKAHGRASVKEIKMITDGASVGRTDTISEDMSDTESTFISGAARPHDSSQGKWRALPVAGCLLPSDFLHVDKHRLEFGTCMEGMDAHDGGTCFCAWYRHADEFWASPDGLSTRAQRLLGSTKVPTTEDSHFQDRFGNTSLHLIAARGQPRDLFELLKTSTHISLTNTGKQTFLHCLGPHWFTDGALPFRHLLRYLECIHFDIFLRDVYGQTIFHILTRHSENCHHYDTILRDYCSNDRLQRDAFGINPSVFMNRTVENKPSESISASLCSLFKRDPSTSPSLTPIKLSSTDGDDAPEEGRTSLRDATPHLQHISDLAREYPSIEDSYGRNALHCAAIAALSLSNLMAPMEVNEKPSPPPSNYQEGKLATAAFKDALRGLREPKHSRARLIVEDLIAAGVDAKAYNAAGNTVLMECAINMPEDADYLAYVEILNLLRNAGADIDARNRRGETALHLAACHGRKLAVRTLLTGGARIHSRNDEGKGVLTVLNELMRKSRFKLHEHTRLEACYVQLADRAGYDIEPTAREEWSVVYFFHPILGSWGGTKPLVPALEIILLSLDEAEPEAKVQVKSEASRVTEANLDRYCAILLLVAGPLRLTLNIGHPS